MREKGKIKMADNWEAAELEVLNSDNPDKVSLSLSLSFHSPLLLQLVKYFGS